MLQTTVYLPSGTRHYALEQSNYCISTIWYKASCSGTVELLYIYHLVQGIMLWNSQTTVYLPSSTRHYALEQWNYCISTIWYKALCSGKVKTPSGPASTITKYPNDQTQNSVHFRRPEASHRHSKSQSHYYAVLMHIHTQSVTCWSTYWQQQNTPKNNNHVAATFHPDVLNRCENFR